jgi:hypothetical protein
MKNKRRVVAAFILLLAGVTFFGMSTTAEAKKKKTVKKVSLSKAKITLSATKYTYNGKAKKPKVTVKYKKKKIAKSKNYTVTYSKNKSAGTAKVTIKAKKTSKLYKGKKTVTFKINKASRTLTADRAEYTAVEGDGAFNLSAKASKGTGTITYSCLTSDVINVSSNGTVTVVAPGTATVNISIPASTNYLAAATTTKVTVSKKTITVDSNASIKNFDYGTQKVKMRNETVYMSADNHRSCPFYSLTEYAWNVLAKYTIPGLAPTTEADLTNQYIQCNNLCPQGFCYAGDYLLTTAYCADDIHNSCIFIYDKNSGAYLRTIVLSVKTHVGGITYDGTNVWICHASSKQLQKITYTNLKKYAQGTKGMVNIDEVTLRDITGYPSAVTYNAKDGYIWVAKNVTLPNYKKYLQNNQTDKLPQMWPYQYVEGEDGAADKLVPATTKKYQADTASEGYLGVKAEDYKASEESEETSGVLITALVSGSEKEITDFTVNEVESEEKENTDMMEKLRDENSVDENGEDEGNNADEDKEIADEDGKKEDDAKEEEESYFLAENDVIISLDGVDITSLANMENVLEQYSGNNSINITIRRTTEDKTVEISGTITLGVYYVEKSVPSRLIPNRVQGLAFSEDGTKLLLSRSTGRNTTKTNYISEVAVYDWDEDDTELGTPIRSIVVPPMIEQIEVKDGYLYMIFESAATLYLEGTDGSGNSEAPIDKLVSMKISF